MTEDVNKNLQSGDEFLLVKYEERDIVMKSLYESSTSTISLNLSIHLLQVLLHHHHSKKLTASNHNSHFHPSNYIRHIILSFLIFSSLRWSEDLACPL